MNKYQATAATAVAEPRPVRKARKGGAPLGWMEHGPARVAEWERLEVFRAARHAGLHPLHLDASVSTLVCREGVFDDSCLRAMLQDYRAGLAVRCVFES